MSMMASQITSLTIVYSTVYSGADQRKYQSSASLAFVRGIHRWPVNSPHKGPVTRKVFPFDDVIMLSCFVVAANADLGNLTLGAEFQLNSNKDTTVLYDENEFKTIVWELVAILSLHFCV